MISVGWVNPGRSSATEVASAKSTRVGSPSPETTMLAGLRSRCNTPHRCIPATARASPLASPSNSSAASGVASAAKVVLPASANTSESPYRGRSTSCVTPSTPRSRCRIPTSRRRRRSASGPSSCFRITVRPAKNSRVTRVRRLSNTASSRSGGSASDSTLPASIRHLPSRVGAPDSVYHRLVGHSDYCGAARRPPPPGQAPTGSVQRGVAAGMQGGSGVPDGRCWSR